MHSRCKAESTFAQAILVNIFVLTQSVNKPRKPHKYVVFKLFEFSLNFQSFYPLSPAEIPNFHKVIHIDTPVRKRIPGAVSSENSENTHDFWFTYFFTATGPRNGLLSRPPYPW